MNLLFSVLLPPPHYSPPPPRDQSGEPVTDFYGRDWISISFIVTLGGKDKNSYVRLFYL